MELRRIKLLCKHIYKMDSLEIEGYYIDFEITDDPTGETIWVNLKQPIAVKVQTTPRFGNDNWVRDIDIIYETTADHYYIRAAENTIINNDLMDSIYELCEQLGMTMNKVAVNFVVINKGFDFVKNNSYIMYPDGTVENNLNSLSLNEEFPKWSPANEYKREYNRIKLFCKYVFQDKIYEEADVSCHSSSGVILEYEYAKLYAIQVYKREDLYITQFWFEKRPSFIGDYHKIREDSYWNESHEKLVKEMADKLGMENCFVMNAIWQQGHTLPKKDSFIMYRDGTIENYL